MLPDPMRVQMKGIKYNEQLFIAGLISGLGLGLFFVEAFSSSKRPTLYIGGLFLAVAGSLLFRKFKC